MTKQYIEIHYRFLHHTSPETAVDFTVRLDPKTLQHVMPERGSIPEWTRLEVKQCEHCPLSADEHVHCPMALSVVDLVDAFKAIFSFSEMEVIVTTAERTITKRTTTQKALSPLFGLYMATSGCPNMDLLKPMARFHLPFATKEETLYRAAGTYLLGQYYLHQQGLPCDLNFEGLSEAYQRIHQVNMGMAARLRNVVQGDANINAIVLLDLFAHELPSAIDLKLRSLAPLFSSYLERAAQAENQVDKPLGA